MPESLSTTVDRRNGLAIVCTRGYLNDQGGEEVARVTYQLIEGGYSVLLFDLAGTTIVTSVGISILIEIFEKLNAIGGRMAFCGLTPTIAKTFEIMGLAQYATIYPDEASAIAQLQPA